MERHFLKCSYCERPLSVNASADELAFILKQNCPLCNEPELRYMGRVQKTNIVRSGVKSACDLRCTNAVGPKCDCVCVNENHGTHRLVVFDKVVGKLKVVEKDLLNNNEEYLARIKRMAVAKVKIKTNVIAFLNYVNRDILSDVKKLGGYWKLEWKAYDRYMVYSQTMKRIEKLEDLKSIQKKINTLSRMIPQIGNSVLYLEALATKEDEKVTA